MRTLSVNSWLLPCLLGGLALATPALAQDDDAPYAYPDEEEERPRPEDTSRRRRAQPKDTTEDTSEDFRRVAEEGDDEDEQDYDRLSGLDDPNTGLAFEVLGGAMLLSSPRGQLAEALPAVGGRFTWEYGRLLNVEALREALWLDVQYTHAGVRDGTKLIIGDTRLHYFSVAPAYEFTFGGSPDYGFYLQAGGGLVYQHTTLEVGGTATPVTGVKSLIQYGVGLRGRSKLSSESNVRLAWRVELMRFRRGYLDDTFLGASLGTAF
jgi:hypothetical protein